MMTNKLMMRTHRQLAKAQKGLVLFVALIALVVMSLAAAALVRSVDSGVLVAGNLAFKQSAIMSAESGMASAYSYIMNNSNTLETQMTGGYYATFTDGRVLSDAATWNNTNSMLINPSTPIDEAGNNVRLILERMCRSTGPADAYQCLTGTGTSAASSNGAKSEGGGSGGGGYCASGCSGSADAVVYRATVRVVGPKNTISYLQAFIY